MTDEPGGLDVAEARKVVKAAVVDNLVRDLLAIDADFRRGAASRASDIRRGDLERQAAMAALSAVVADLREMQVPSQVLEILLNSLLQVEETGQTPSIFLREKPPHRPPAATAKEVLMGSAAAVAVALTGTDEALTQKEADKRVAQTLVATGRPELLKVTARTIRSWRERFGDGYVDNTPGAKTYQAIQAYVQAAPRGRPVGWPALEEALLARAAALPDKPPS